MAHRKIDLDALSPELTEPQRREIDARSEELDRALVAGEPGGIPWDEVLRRIKAH